MYNIYTVWEHCWIILVLTVCCEEPALFVWAAHVIFFYWSAFIYIFTNLAWFQVHHYLLSMTTLAYAYALKPGTCMCMLYTLDLAVSWSWSCLTRSCSALIASWPTRSIPFSLTLADANSFLLRRSCSKVSLILSTSWNKGHTSTLGMSISCLHHLYHYHYIRSFLNITFWLSLILSYSYCVHIITFWSVLIMLIKFMFYKISSLYI